MPAVFGTLGRFLLAFAATMLLPLLYAVWIGERSQPFVLSFIFTALAGAALAAESRRTQREPTQREALLIVFLVWMATALFGGLPFYFSPYFPKFVDAFFESASGFTTTGATVLPNVEVLTRSLQFWRHFSHWLGGMGIVLLGIAILPLVGAGGMPLYRAEFSGAKSEKVRPRIKETALALWKIYFALTLAEFVALRWAGVNAYEALCHTFSTLGTGGFSTRAASIAGFGNLWVEIIIIVFMLLASINFTLHYRLWIERRPGSFFADVEFRFFMIVVATASMAIALVLVGISGLPAGAALRASLFQVSSIISTTGFATADFEIWPPFTQMLLLALMFLGGCTGSTAGGLKASRILLVLKMAGREFKRLVERRGIFTIHMGTQSIPESATQSLLSLIYLALLVNAIGCLLLALAGVDVLTSISAVVACMFNVGPGLGGVGPIDNYGHLPALAKWVLSICMIAGRLEFYTVMVIFAPAFWRK